MALFLERFELSFMAKIKVFSQKCPQKLIKLSNIINAVDEKIKTVKCKKESKRGCNGKSVKCITHDLWDDLEIHINSFFEKNTLKDIIYRVHKIKQKELNQ